MRILHINKFFYLKGGSEQYMFGVAELFERKGHKIGYFSMKDRKNAHSGWEDFFTENVEYSENRSLMENVKLSLKTIYSLEAERKLDALINVFRPDVAHLHNFSHQLTPSILGILSAKQIPSVMTLHDYKLVCPTYNMLNHGRICDLCSSGRFWKCAATRCHKDSFAKSLLLSIESYAHHNVLKSYRHISHFICPTVFVKETVKKMGFDGRLVHIPHFPRFESLKGAEPPKKGDYVAFCGRLSREKGIMTLIDAVKDLPIQLKVIGDGPDAPLIRKRLKDEKINNVELLGYLCNYDVLDFISASRALIMPSEWNEVFGLSIIEAYLMGVPVIASDIGGIKEIVRDGVTGLLFRPGNHIDLKEKIKRAINDPSGFEEMGRAAVDLVRSEFSSASHYDKLLAVYNEAVEIKRG